LLKEFNKWAIKPKKDISTNDLTNLVEAWLIAEAMTVSSSTISESSGVITVEMEQGTSIQFNIISKEPNLILSRTDMGIQYNMSPFSSEQLFLKVGTMD